MVPSGKEPAEATDQQEPPETVQDTRWLNGVNRQLRPDAPSQRQAASAAAAAKRSANAMTRDESLAKKAKHKREVRAQKAAEKAAAAAAARAAAARAAEDAVVAEGGVEVVLVPTLETFNGWCMQYYGEPIGEEEWDAFQAFGVFSELEREDCYDQAFIELFFIWRDSDEYKRYQIELQPVDYDAHEPPPPVQPRTAQPKCVECRRTECACNPGAPDDDDPYQNPGAWANDMVGPSGWQDSPRSPAQETGDDDWWDNMIERELERRSTWWYEERLNMGWGERRVQSQWERERQEREARWARERAAGPPPRREEPRFGPRGDAAGDILFRTERETWYQRFTGSSIKGVSLQQQNELCDTYARRFREYSDGREGNKAAQTQRTDPDLLSMPQLTNLCMSCGKVRPGENGLSHVEARSDGTPRRFSERECRQCFATAE